MNRAKIQDYIDQREDQRADLYHFEDQADDHFLLNGHPYQLLMNYRDGFDGEELAKRFSNILSKYDYIVGDWGYQQLRLRGFYDSSSPLFEANRGFDRIQDYLYEDCNFGCAYFVVKNCDVQLPRRRHRRRHHRTSPVIHERRKQIRQPAVRRRQDQVAESVADGHGKHKFVMHKRRSKTRRGTKNDK